MKNMFCKLGGLHRPFLLATALATSFFSGGAVAQAYPTQPVTIVVPFSAGAGTDLIARLLGEKLSPRIGQNVLVENRVGAAGTIGTAYVGKAPADGHVLLFVPGSMAFAHMVIKVAPGSSYDPVNDFTPVIEVGKTPVYLVTGSGSGFKTFKEVVAAPKSRQLAYGSAGAGSILHIIGEVVKKETGVNFVHVPYKGVAPAVTDVLGGHIPFAYGSLTTIKPYMGGGKLVVLAITGRERTPLTPEVPTLNELGFKNIDLNSWYGVFGPKGMPAATVRTLNTHLNEILKMPDVVERMASFGSTPVGGPPETLAKTNSTDVEVFGKIIRDLKIQAN